MNLRPSHQSRTFLARNLGRFACRVSHPAAFTLIELILVMAILIIAVSITAPALASFFRGRTLDSEARRLLSLTREGQSRAISEGLPMELWVDQTQRAYGLEAEPSYEQNDSKAVGFALEKDIQLQVVSNNSLSSSPAAPLPMSGATSSAPVRSNHPSLPRIRFLPDGSISETSPQMLELTGRDGSALWVALARNRLNYEIRSQASR
jgi:Tfp pilus assembly protein FimT